MNPVFLHKGIPYTKIVPAKRLFNSTTVHEVVTRGDIFALNLQSGIFTVLPQGADSTHSQGADSNANSDTIRK